MEVCRRSRRRRKTSQNSVFENDDMLMEILVRLPMKVKVLCKAVCKRWFSLISSSWFANCVLSRENNNPQWDFLHKSKYSKRLQVAFGHYPELNSQNSKLDSLFNDQNIKLLGSDNGLILCAKCEEYNRNHSEYYVCNPITGQWVSLPKPQVHENVLVGFRVSCHDGITTYKVVRGINLFFYCIFSFEVFSSDVGEWSHGLSRPGYLVSLCDSVTLKGIIHWCCFSAIIAYDLDKNKLRIINLPSNVVAPSVRASFGVSCGHLCFMHFDHNFSILSVFVLNDYDMNEWRLVQKITVNNVLAANQIPLNKYSFRSDKLVFHPFDIDVVYLEAPLGKMALLNLQTQGLTSVEEENRIPWLFGRVVSFVLQPFPTPVPQPIWETD